MNHGSLFSGIGGFDLAAQWMGWNNVFHCEWNEFGKKVLNYYWPNAISYDDITNTDFSIHRETIDILTGGFPCQPYSQAGKRLGKEDDRHLWPEMLRAIREIQPRYIVGENVFGIVNWNGGLVFNEVQTDLEAEGYEIQPVVLPACAVNATHRRDRVWFVAYANDTGANDTCRTDGNGETENEGREGIALPEFRESSGNGFATNPNECAERSSGTGSGIESNGSGNDDESESWRKQTEQHNRCSNVLRTDTYTERKRQQEQGQPKRPVHTKTDSEWKASWAYDDGRWPTQSPICSGNDGFPKRLDGITFPKWRNESIKAYGNAIVPQVAFEIFKVINEMSK
jgi:DNA (cytosine-5)-methyltransferase 1